MRKLRFVREPVVCHIELYINRLVVGRAVIRFATIDIHHLQRAKNVSDLLIHEQNFAGYIYRY